MEIGLVNMNPTKKPEVFIQTLHSLHCFIHVLDCSEMDSNEILKSIQESPIQKWIFTGSPSSVYDTNVPTVPIQILDMSEKKFFLICYSMESALIQLGYPVIKRIENKKEEFILHHNIDMLVDPAKLYRNHQYYTPFSDNGIFIANYESEAMIAVFKNSVMTQFHPEKTEDGTQMLFKWIFA